MPSTEKIVDSFPNPTIQPIIGKPTYESIRRVHLKLNANAASIQSHLGNGRLGLLALTVTPVVFNTLSHLPFVAPRNPGPNAVIPPAQTAAQISTIRETYETQAKLYQQYDATDKALKQQLINAVDDMFISAISHRHIGYANVTTLQILTHLYDTYAIIRDPDLTENKERMEAAYDINMPIETLFEQIEDAVEYAAQAHTPFTNAQVVSTAYMLVHKTGMFTDECKAWRRITRNLKTWDRFKDDFSEAYMDIEATATARTAGFQANNANLDSIHQDTVVAIENLANATLADRESIATLTTTIGKLTVDLAETNARLAKALADNASLTTKLAGRKNTTNINRNVSYTNYCWTHGPTSSHSSKDCTRQAEGHQKEATDGNRMGGRQTKWVFQRRQ